MSLYDKAEPFKVQEYRDKTFQPGSMLNVNVIPALELCVCCGVRRTRVTGKETARGFVCHGCNTKRPNP